VVVVGFMQLFAALLSPDPTSANLVHCMVLGHSS
jgi:hypothetical protein